MKIRSKFISMILTVTVFILGIGPVSLVKADTVNPQIFNSAIKSLKLDPEKEKQAIELVNKVKPYLKQNGKKLTLTTHDEKKLNLSKEEIKQFEFGLDKSSTIKISVTKDSLSTNFSNSYLSKLAGHNNVGQVSPYISAYNDGSTLHVTISPWTIAGVVLLSAAVALALGLYALLADFDGATYIIFDEYLVYKKDFLNAISQVLAWGATTIGAIGGVILLNGDIHIDISSDIFSWDGGLVHVYNNVAEDWLWFKLW